jgi:hypothetical protein
VHLEPIAIVDALRRGPSRSDETTSANPAIPLISVAVKPRERLADLDALHSGRDAPRASRRACAHKFDPPLG